MTSRRQRHDELENRLVDFGIGVCRQVLNGPRHRIMEHLAGQLLRCATSPAAHYSEARDAESRRDFIHKIKLCLKELRESRVWIRYLRAFTENGQGNERLLAECDELIAIMVASLRTARS